MSIEPALDAFAKAYRRGVSQCLSTRLVADLETPVSARLKLVQAFAGPNILLESVEGGAVRGRYSIIGLAPDLTWRCQGGVAALSLDGETFHDEGLAPFASLRALLKASALELAGDLPPMACGVFGYLGYDMVRQMERLPADHPDPIGVPDAILIRPLLVVVFDAVKDEMIVVTPVRPKAGVTARAAYEKASDLLERAVAALEGPLGHEAASGAAGASSVLLSGDAARSNTAPEVYEAMVARAKEYILAGDIFQVVLSQRFSQPFDLPAFSLYRALRRVNPSPYLCHLDFGSFQIVCSSPEILVRVRDGKVTIRPIAGTRRRGETAAEDRALEAELLADPKERAEHLMLLDLGRNDTGRVSRIGSVKVTESFFIERYSQVMHIVSNVEGALAEGKDAIDAMIAGFPAGTVSGAPKVRAMQIIDELERDKRGPYGGCIGYFGADGALDSCIVLRTAVVKDGMMHVQAGAGIVHDSNPRSEQIECENKAKALFRAADTAVRFASRARRGQ
jgi:anthranilate synthase component 1